MQDFDHPSFKTLITGTSGTGKTVLFEKILRREKARIKFVFDHQGEFSKRFKIPAVFDGEGLCHKTAQGGYVVFDPVQLYPGRSEEAFAFFCDFVFSISTEVKGRKILACDELQKLTCTREEPQELLTVLDTGRRYQVDALMISQAPNRIHNGIRNQLTQVYTFRQSDTNAIGYLKENGFDEDKIRNLAKHHYIFRDLGTSESREGCEKI